MLLAGCNTPQTVRQESFPVGRSGDVPITKVAIVPFTASGTLARSGPTNSTESADTIRRLVTRYVSEALSAKGVRVIPADDFQAALDRSNIQGTTLERRAVANVAAFEFGAQGVVFGDVTRYRDRAGSAAGATEAAGVGFQVQLFHAPAARRLWSAVFDETQRPLNENLLNAPRYPGGGTRWLTADELARWGARELARSMPAGP